LALELDLEILLRSMAFRLRLTMGLVLSRDKTLLCASLQAKAPGRQSCGILRQAHFITTSEKGVSEPCWVGKLLITLHEEQPYVKLILLGTVAITDNSS
jgi:hypothetical protein